MAILNKKLTAPYIRQTAGCGDGLDWFLRNFGEDGQPTIRIAFRNNEITDEYKAWILENLRDIETEKLDDDAVSYKIRQIHKNANRQEVKARFFLSYNVKLSDADTHEVLEQRFVREKILEDKTFTYPVTHTREDIDKALDEETLSILQ